MSFYDVSSPSSAFESGFDGPIYCLLISCHCGQFLLLCLAVATTLAAFCLCGVVASGAALWFTCLQVLYLKINGVEDTRYNQISGQPRENEMMFAGLNNVGEDCTSSPGKCLALYETCNVSTPPRQANI